MKNLLIIHAHDMGRYCSPYGIAAQTPHLERLARTGCMFRNMHSVAPTCSPSRAALWTGRTAHEMGMLGLVHRGFDLNDRQRHLARHLVAHGFQTALAGGQHEYDPVHPEPVYQQLLVAEQDGDLHQDEQATRAAVKFLEDAPQQPWMLSVGFFYPHRDFITSPDPKRAHFVQVPPILPDMPEVRSDYADYLTSLEATDQRVGQIMTALAENGKAEDTLIIFTTDHGIAFPEMKCNLTAHGTGITMLLRAPGLVEDGRAIDGLVSNMDVVPTVCELLNVPIPEEIHGVSMVPLLRGEKATVREDIFSEINIHAAAEPARAVRTERYCFIRRFDNDTRRPLANIDDGPAKDVWLREGRGDEPLQTLALYDLRRDPMERLNVVGDPAYATVREEMEKRLHHWMVTTNDPLLKGPLIVPAGAKINTRESMDPIEGPFI